MPTSVEFVINQNNDIVKVCQDWDRFARENNAPELLGAAVIGHPLSEFVSGIITKKFISNLLSIARSRKDPVAFEYRCDSPQVRRYMKMEVHCIAGGNVRFIHTELRTELRIRPINFIRKTIREKNTLIRCSMCNLVLIKNYWGEFEVDANSSSVTEVYVTYGICPACQAKLGAA
jgi:hypothetical protein